MVDFIFQLDQLTTAKGYKILKNGIVNKHYIYSQLNVIIRADRAVNISFYANKFMTVRYAIKINQ